MRWGRRARATPGTDRRPGSRGPAKPLVRCAVTRGPGQAPRPAPGSTSCTGRGASRSDNEAAGIAVSGRCQRGQGYHPFRCMTPHESVYRDGRAIEAPAPAHTRAWTRSGRHRSSDATDARAVPAAGRPGSGACWSKRTSVPTTTATPYPGREGRPVRNASKDRPDARALRRMPVLTDRCADRRARRYPPSASRVLGRVCGVRHDHRPRRCSLPPHRGTQRTPVGRRGEPRHAGEQATAQNSVSPDRRAACASTPAGKGSSV